MTTHQGGTHVDSRNSCILLFHDRSWIGNDACCGVCMSMTGHQAFHEDEETITLTPTESEWTALQSAIYAYVYGYVPVEHMTYEDLRARLKLVDARITTLSQGS